MIREVLFAGLVLALLLSSCAPKRSEISLDTARIPAAQLIELLQEHDRDLRTIVGRGIVSFESPRLAGSASFELSLKRPDSLLVVFEGPFGIDLGTLFLSRTQYIMYNSTDNSVVRGVPSTHAIRAVIPFDLSYDDILSAFSGTLSFPKDQRHLRRYSISEGQFFLSFSRGDSTLNYWVDPSYLRVSRYEVVDNEQRQLLEARFSNFLEQDNASAPRRISIGFPQEGRYLALSYSKMNVNDPPPSFEFTIPPNAHTVIR